jgi:anthranilate synthase component 2
LEAKVTVWEDEKVIIDEIELFDAVIFSPGPGLPQEKKSLIAVLEKYATSKKILGVCLGMQGIAHYFGETLYNLSEVKHGVEATIKLENENPLFKGLEKEQVVGLYHSWAVGLNDNSELIPLAVSSEGVIMALKHKNLPIYGVQFHPESILTPNGKEILKNFLDIC